MSEVDVRFFDTTLRDGAQSVPEDHQIADGEKPEVARSIAELGVQVIEAGFPATPGDMEEVREVAGTVGQEKFDAITWVNAVGCETSQQVPVIAGLCRAIEQDIDTAVEALGDAVRPRIHTFVSTDPDHMAVKHPQMSPDDVLAMGVRAVQYANAQVGDNPNATVEFSMEAAATTDMDFLERVVRSGIQAGADVINVPDTVGKKNPMQMQDFYANVVKWVMAENPEVVISGHNHNDMDMAVANSLMLVYVADAFAHQNNATVNIQVESTICGLGERAGNADIFPFMAGLFESIAEMRSDIRWGINPALSVLTAQRVMKYFKYEVDRQSPVVGRGTITHTSGIHSDGVIKGAEAGRHDIYSPRDPRFWGHDEPAIHEDGKYQGRRGRQAAMCR